MKLARRRQAAEPARGHPDELEALLRAGRAVAEGIPLDRALEQILDAAIRLVRADEGSIQLLDRATLTLGVAAARGLGPEEQRQRIALGQGISGSVAAAGEAVLLPSAIDIDRFIGHVPKSRRIYASICAPLRTRGEMLGVLNVNQMRAGKTFSERDLRLISLFAENAAQAIAAARQGEDARRHALEVEILRGAMVRLGTTLDLPALAETILQESLTLAASTAAFVVVAPADDAPPNLVRFAGLPREAIRAVLDRPGLRHLRIPAEVRVIGDVPADPAFAPLGPSLDDRALALVPLRASDGHLGGLLGVAIDRAAAPEGTRILGTYGTLAGLALANASLHAAVSTTAAELETIVRALDLPIMLVDGDGTFRTINAAAALALRLSPEFEVGQSAHGKLPPEMEALILNRGDDLSAEVAVRIAGEERAYRITAATVGGNGSATRIAAFTDITSVHELEQHKADFLAVIGHELRTPLTSIRGFAWTLAKRGETLPEDVRAEAIRSIVVQSERLERLIEDLLYISGIERGRPPVKLGWEDANDICNAIIAEVSRRRPDRMIRPALSSREEPIYTDRVKVEQILSHLLDNALKYSGEDTFADVHLTSGEHWVSIAVVDEGVGIYSGDLGRIFEPFVQVDSSSTRSAGGTGVGLFVARTLADALGGRIEVESTLGKGTTFTLILPRRMPDPQSEGS